MILMARLLMILLTVSTMSACETKKQQATNIQKNDTASTTTRPQTLRVQGNVVDRILDTLQTLQIVKEAARTIDSASLGARNISFMPDSVALQEDELYIAAGDNRPERFETFIHFFVNVKNMNIRVYDVIQDDTVEVKEYERRHTLGKN
jgi:hypoxanthine phosphoribosyltransferase